MIHLMRYRVDRGFLGCERRVGKRQVYLTVRRAQIWPPISDTYPNLPGSCSYLS